MNYCIKVIMIIVLLSTSFNAFSQEKNIELVSKEYAIKLDLDSKKTKQLKTILVKFKEEFDKAKDVFEYNKVFKRETYAVHLLLTSDEFTEFIKLRKNIEPNKKVQSL